VSGICQGTVREVLFLPYYIIKRKIEKEKKGILKGEKGKNLWPSPYF